MKLAYFNLAITNRHDRSHSILSKIDQQANVAQELNLPFDFFWLPGKTHPGDERYTNLNILPVGGNNLLTTRWHQCRTLNKLMKHYDRAILRHPLMDPVLYCFLRNRERMILEHHTLETEELKTTGDIRRIFETTIARRWIRGFRALTAVTPEIVDYEIRRSGFSGPTGFFPNTIDLEGFRDFQERPHRGADEPLRVIMVATHFSPWHGLETITGQMESSPPALPFELHLVGQLDPSMKSRCERFPAIKIHGTLSAPEVHRLYRDMDIGLGSLTFSRIGLTQGTPLKVREYLAAGLPVVLGYDDPAIPKDFPYALYQKPIDLAKILEFARGHRETPGARIRDAAGPYIDARTLTRQLFDFCIKT